MSRKEAQDLYDNLFPIAAGIVAKGQEHAPMIFGKFDSGIKAGTLAGVAKDTMAQIHRIAGQALHQHDGHEARRRSGCADPRSHPSGQAPLPQVPGDASAPEAAIWAWLSDGHVVRR